MDLKIFAAGFVLEVIKWKPASRPPSSDTEPNQDSQTRIYNQAFVLGWVDQRQFESISLLAFGIF